MDNIPVSLLLGALVVLMLISAFFSASETSLLSLNRYRLKHHVRIKHRGAICADQLLKQPERLIGMILLGNNFANILASSIATILGYQLYGELGVMIVPFILTVFILIFSEVTPKTVAILYPQPIAYFSSHIYVPLLKIFSPFLWMINSSTNLLLLLLRVDKESARPHHISKEELRTILLESESILPARQQMLLNLVDLEKITVEDIMVPRGDIIGLDLNDDWQDVLTQIRDSQYGKLPVYRGHIDQVEGVFTVRHAVRFIDDENFTEEKLLSILKKPYFIPESTPLTQLLINLQAEKQRMGFVVNEYGDIQGLATIQAILEEIVGEFTSNPSTKMKEIHRQDDGSYLIEGGAHVRDVNQALHWTLPSIGPRTINGLVLEYLESIPKPGTSILIDGHPVEIVQVFDNLIKIVRIYPKIKDPAIHSSQH